MAAPNVPPSRLDEYFDNTPNPFGTLHELADQYAPGPNPQPGDCLMRTDSNGYILCFLATINGNPEALTFPFVSSRAGFALEKHILCGNIGADGQLPDILSLDAQAFRLTNNHGVNTTATTTMAWANNPNVELLPPVPAGAANRVEIRCRRTVPIPHEFIGAILRYKDQGQLTWRRLWTEIVDAQILGDIQREGSYQTFIEYVRIASTQGAPPVAGGQPVPPPTDHAYNFGPFSARVRSLALQKLRAFLPGLGAPAGIAAQLVQVQQNQAAAAAAAAAAQAAAAAPSTIQGETPALFLTLCQVCEVTTEANIPGFYRSIVGVRSGSWLAHATQALAVTCAGLGFMPPILSPSLANDLGRGVFLGAGLNDMTRGFSLFRVRTPYGHGAEAARQRNEAYNILATGAGVVQADAVNMVLATNDIDPPAGGTQFRIYLMAQYAMLATFIGEHSRATTEYQAQVMEKLDNIMMSTELLFQDQRVRNEVYLKIMVYIVRETDYYFAQLQHPPAAGPAAIQVPGYRDIHEHLRTGRIRYLTTIPEELVRIAPATANPQGPPSIPRGGGGGGPNTHGNNGGGSGQQNQQVSRPNQNRNLKAAWAGTQHASIFGPGAPYHDPNASGRKKIVQADSPDTRRICLPMALTGRCYANCRGKHEELSEAECRRVAQAGGFQI